MVWEDPWSGSERRGPFQCDPYRSPLLRDWESGFVVSHGPWKGDLYSTIDGSPTSVLEAGLGFTGLLVLAGSGVGRRPVGAARRSAPSCPRTSYGWQSVAAHRCEGLHEHAVGAPHRGVRRSLLHSMDETGPALPRAVTRLPPPARSRHTHGALVAVRSLRKLSHLEEALVGAACLLIMSSLWWFTGEGAPP
ncbi:hypothetical protein ACR6C2_14670 [Streptomyces sp. INA 01156]